MTAFYKAFLNSVILAATLIYFGANACQADTGASIYHDAVAQGWVPPPEQKKCVHEPEDSSAGLKGLLDHKSLKDVFFGNEKECLENLHLLENGQLKSSAMISAGALNNFFSGCEFVMRDKYNDFNQLNSALSFQNRDALVGGLWQQLAHRSHGQLVCRQSVINQYFASAQKKEELNKKAGDKFKLVIEDITALDILNQKNKSAARNEAKVSSTYDCSGLAGIMCKQIANGRTEKDIASYDAAIAAKLSQIPFGYEPHVADALLQMVNKGKFDPQAYANAMAQAQKSYRDLDKYWDDKRIPGSTKGTESFCITSDFKLQAAAGEWSAADQLLEQAIKNKSLSPEQKLFAQCYIRSHYKDAPKNATDTKNMAVELAVDAGIALSMVATEGTAAGLYATAANLGINTGIFANQLQETYDACTAQNFIVSADKAESCNAEKDFEREASQSPASSCGAAAGWAAFSALPIPFEIRALAKAKMAERAGVATEDLLVATNKSSSASSAAAEAAPVEEIVVEAPHDNKIMLAVTANKAGKTPEQIARDLAAEQKIPKAELARFTQKVKDAHDRVQKLESAYGQDLLKLKAELGDADYAEVVSLISKAEQKNISRETILQKLRDAEGVCKI